MLSKLLTSVFLFTLIGCESKEYKKNENSNVDVVSELNQGDYKTVISKLEKKSEKTPREKYYLASAIAQKAGVDVFSLYGVLELQLFQKKALDWSELSKDKNPYAKFMKNETKEEAKLRRTKRKEKWKKYLPHIVEKNDINLTLISFQELHSTYPDLSEHDYDETVTRLEKEYQKIEKDELSQEQKYKSWVKLDEDEHLSDLSPGSFLLARYYHDKLKLEYIEDNYINSTGTGSQAGGVQVGLMNFLWNTYESIPMLKKMPSLSNDQQRLVTESMELFQELSKDKEFGNVSLKNTLILGAVSFLSIYKESFDLDDIHAPMDLLCSFDVTKMIDNYGTIRERVLFLAELTPQLDKDNKLKNFKAEIENLKYKMPEEIEVERQEKFTDEVENFKLEQCFNG
jgi:hypothetical protein